MVIEALDLQNYRNYELLGMKFSPETNILYGDNAQGKTNILEAIYVAGTTKSHRASKDREIIAFDSDEAHIKMLVRKNNISRRIDMHLKKNKTKGVAIDGIPIKRAVDLLGIINIVFFSPEDLNIIKSGPAERRRFMDMELCQLDKIYVHNLVNYNKALLQRNKLLKDISFIPSLADTLDVWDEQLVSYGNELIRIRRDFVNNLNSIIYDIHGRLSGNKEQLKLIYEPIVTEEEFMSRLLSSREKDIRQKTTVYGPHRDDLSFMLGDMDVRKYGSQGQQRTCALSLKLSEIELVKLLTGDTPVLLLDDVFSELDANRQNYLLDSISNVQTIVTCTGLDEFINYRFHLDKVFYVMNGHVVEKN